METRENIIKYIRRNRVSTTEVADALGKNGVLPDIFPINSGHHEVGKVRCVFTANESNYAVHEQIRHIEEGEIVIIFTHNCEGRAIIGDLVSKYILLYQGAKALVVDGKVRDLSGIRREGFKVWSNGTTPLGCFNKKVDSFPEDKRQEIATKYDGAIAVCDEGGVVLIENRLITENTLERLKRIEMQEDIWFFCLDTLGWDTKQIVCDKEYLQRPEMFSSVQIENLEELSKPLDP
ncbi:MAG: RraA family protein [Halobacteriovoraceae bacterium]|nr:RraA family protein [Halobacteriovoraceae bacterium]